MNIFQTEGKTVNYCTKFIPFVNKIKYPVGKITFIPTGYLLGFFW